LTIDFIPSSAKIGLDAFNLGYLMDDFNEFKIQGIPNILIIDFENLKYNMLGLLTFFPKKVKYFHKICKSWIVGLIFT
jgi:hypothetical protein